MYKILNVAVAIICIVCIYVYTCTVLIQYVYVYIHIFCHLSAWISGCIIKKITEHCLSIMIYSSFAEWSPRQTAVWATSGRQPPSAGPGKEPVSDITDMQHMRQCIIMSVLCFILFIYGPFYHLNHFHLLHSAEAYCPSHLLSSTTCQMELGSPWRRARWYVNFINVHIN